MNARNNSILQLSDGGFDAYSFVDEDSTDHLLFGGQEQHLPSFQEQFTHNDNGTLVSNPSVGVYTRRRPPRLLGGSDTDPSQYPDPSEFPGYNPNPSQGQVFELDDDELGPWESDFVFPEDVQEPALQPRTLQPLPLQQNQYAQPQPVHPQLPVQPQLPQLPLTQPPHPPKLAP